MGGAYKSLNGGDKADADSANGPARKQKSRVLIVPSRGVTYRYVSTVDGMQKAGGFPIAIAADNILTSVRNVGTGI